MRDDMHEVIVERPRWGHQMRHVRRARRVDPKRTAVHDPESLPFRIGLRRGASLGRYTQSLSENLAPLRRYLERQVNRPWDKVWSEISANLKATNTVQQHVRDHVGDFVAMKTFVRDGTVWIAHQHYSRETSLADSNHLLYVDPRTGILRRNKHFRKYPKLRREKAAAEARERAHRMRELGPLLQLHLLNDCWWEVTLAYRQWIPKRGYASYVDVVIGAGMTALPPAELYGQDGVYAAKKRQLTSAEIVKLGLRD
jgi:hypothetical protein